MVAEKPSVAKAIKRVLNQIDSKVFITSLKGHLMDSNLPQGFEWGKVDPKEILNLRKIPMIIKDVKKYRELKKVLESVKGELVIATDNDPEGELIGYEILRVKKSIKEESKVLRMRFNSVDEAEILKAWNNLEEGLKWRWVYKALFRQIFDLITGFAFTRLLTSLTNKLISWGSCQTPTLYFIVEREREIMNFKPKKFWFIEAILEHNLSVRSEIFYEKEEAEMAYKIVKNAHYASISSYSEFKSVVKRPLPLITDDLLRDFVKISRITSAKVLNLAEELYSNGYISYPRTETNIYYEGFDFEKCLKAILSSKLGEEVTHKIEKLAPLNGKLDDKAHPPIHPLKPYPMDKSLKWKLWEYVARRFLANAYCKNALKLFQRIELIIEGINFFTEGSYFLEEGFYKVFYYFKPNEKPLPKLKEGKIIRVIEIELKEGITKPPSRMKESELLSAMIKNNIGTDATRAIFPQLIVKRGYALRSDVFIPTKLGMRFIEVLEKVDKKLVTPETRRFVEELMNRIEGGEIGMNEALDKSLNLYKELYLKCESMKDEIKSGFLSCL